MKVIIIGASGLLGLNFYECLKSKKINTFGTYFKNKKKKEFIKFDITKDKLTDKFNDISKEDIIIIFSACSNPSWVSKNKKYAKNVNIHSTKKLINNLIRLNPKIIFMSSVEVFDGTKKIFFENDKVNPLNYYGKTKLEVEKYIKRNYKNYLICRTSWNSAYYLHNRCVIELTYKSILKSNALMAEDNIFSITYVKDLCKILFRNLRTKKKIIHISNNEKITRSDLANKIKSFSKLKKRMDFETVPFSKIKYTEPRALQNLLQSRDKSISKGFQFLKIQKLIEKKVKLLDKLYSN